ncbi:hypothetical protein [Pantoea sp.]|uniref:hypothetical protein n=1 Tax=Pantoea sp. TaxID=69393 RepID=UPI0031D8FD69
MVTLPMFFNKYDATAKFSSISSKAGKLAADILQKFTHGRRCMKKLILSALILMTTAPVAHGQENIEYEQIKPSVIAFLTRAAGPSDGCDIFKNIYSKDLTNNQNKKMMLGLCDGDIDFSQPISFSQMSTHHVGGADYVCGIISGRTKLNRKIGARFISFEPYHLILNVKYSRRPIAYTVDDGFLVDDYRMQVKSFNELNDKYCR